jgi:hypothetical protein
MIIETMILAGASLVSGLCIGRACKKAKEPVINNHYGEEILSEIARLINDMEKERELKEMLKKNEEIKK